jgi:hypothetical protein
VVIGVVLVFKHALLDQGHFTQWPVLISSVLIGSITYVLFVFFIDRKTMMDGLALVKGGFSENVP